MSDAGILYSRLCHMADSAGTGHPPNPPARINGFGGVPLNSHGNPGAPRTPPEKLHLTEANSFVSKRRPFFPSQYTPPNSAHSR